MFIRSERLFLRPGWPEDWPELLTRIGAEGAAHNRSLPAGGGDPRLPQFLVTLPTSLAPAEIVGAIGLADRGHGAELGCWIAREHWNRGYATEAIRAVLGLARTLGHRRIRAVPPLETPAAARVLRKSGFAPARSGERAQVVALDAPGNCDAGEDAVPAMRVA